MPCVHSGFLMHLFLFPVLEVLALENESQMTYKLRPLVLTQYSKTHSSNFPLLVLFEFAIFGIFG